MKKLILPKFVSQEHVKLIYFFSFLDLFNVMCVMVLLECMYVYHKHAW